MTQFLSPSRVFVRRCTLRALTNEGRDGRAGRAGHTRGGAVCALVDVGLLYSGRGLCRISESASNLPQACIQGSPRLRGSDPAIAAAIEQALERSPTFRQLMAAVNRTDGIAYVHYGACGRNVRACLLLAITQAGPHRILHIGVDSRRKGHDLMVVIGHELSHAVELLNVPTVIDATTARNYYRRNAAIERYSFETEEAIEIELKIDKELHQWANRFSERLRRRATRRSRSHSVLIGSSNIYELRRVEDLGGPYQFLLRAGRAVLIPVFSGTLERGPSPFILPLNQERERAVRWSKDLGRSLDYLETRPDIDTQKLGLYGVSSGATHGVWMTVVHRRFKTAVIASGGLFRNQPGN